MVELQGGWHVICYPMYTISWRRAKKKLRGESIARSYLLSGVEARAINALEEQCVYLRGVGEDSVLEHLSAQFDGSDILTQPSPSGFKATADSSISERTWYRANLVGEHHAFPPDKII